MLNRFLLPFCILISQHLLAQCGNCDSVLRAQGYHILTDAEIRNNPGLLISAEKVQCSCDCGGRNEPIGEGIKFRGKWGYVSLRTGVNYDELRTSGFFVDGFRFDRPRQNYISAAFDLDAPEWSGIVLRAEVAWKPQRFDGTMETAGQGPTQWQIKANTIGKEISLLYKSTKGKLRWFAGVGLGKDRTKIKQNTWIDYLFDKPRTTESGIEIYQSNWFTSLSAGFMYRNRIEVRYKRIGTQWSPDPMQYNIKNKENVITIGYRL